MGEIEVEIYRAPILSVSPTMDNKTLVISSGKKLISSLVNNSIRIVSNEFYRRGSLGGWAVRVAPQISGYAGDTITLNSGVTDISSAMVTYISADNSFTEYSFNG